MSRSRQRLDEGKGLFKFTHQEVASCDGPTEKAGMVVVEVVGQVKEFLMTSEQAKRQPEWHC